MVKNKKENLSQTKEIIGLTLMSTMNILTLSLDEYLGDILTLRSQESSFFCHEKMRFNFSALCYEYKNLSFLQQQSSRDAKLFVISLE